MKSGVTENKQTVKNFSLFLFLLYTKMMWLLFKIVKISFFFPVSIYRILVV